MKFVVYADVHAQVAPFEAVLKEVEKEKADKEVMAGDLVMLGPDPGAIVEMIRGRDCDVIVGNLDLWVVDKRWEWMKPKTVHHEWMMEMAKGTRDRMTDDQIRYLRTLPFSLSYMPEPGHEFLVFHSTPREIGDTTALPLRYTDEEVKERIDGGLGRDHGPRPHPRSVDSPGRGADHRLLRRGGDVVGRRSASILCGGRI